MRIAPGARNAQDLELRTLQSEPNGEGVINIAADVGVDDNFFGCIGSRRRRLGLSAYGRTEEDTNSKHSGD
jgi:hypothetical protein